MVRIAGVLLSLVLLVWLVEPLTSHPVYLEVFRADPFRRADVDGCVTCHIDPDGGGQRNEFGSAVEAADHSITPMIRANFPDRFEFQTTKLADGKVFYFSDPKSQYAVLEREEEKFLIDLVSLAIDTGEKEEAAPPGNTLSFFVTSEGPGSGGRLGGLAGADRYCQTLGEAVGEGEKTWRAYLSTSFGDERAVNAGDRIGSGPWYNANGNMIARGPVDLHTGNLLTKAMAINERGEMISGRGDDSNRHDILTGSLPDGTAAIGMNCSNWTSNNDGSAMVGHHDRQGRGESGSSWNSAHPSRGCSQEDLRGSGGDGLFYCFALQ